MESDFTSLYRRTLESLNFAVGSSKNEAAFNAYQSGKHTLKTDVTTNVDALLACVKAYSSYSRLEIQKLPEAQREIELQKLQLLEGVVLGAVAAIKNADPLSTQPQYFMFFLLGYVTDSINRQSGYNN